MNWAFWKKKPDPDLTAEQAFAASQAKHEILRAEREAEDFRNLVLSFQKNLAEAIRCGLFRTTVFGLGRDLTKRNIPFEAYLDNLGFKYQFMDQTRWYFYQVSWGEGVGS